LQSFAKGINPAAYVLICDLAVSHHAKPRYTPDANLLFLTETDYPVLVAGFTRLDHRTFQHDESRIVITLFGPASLELKGERANEIFATSVQHAGMLIASRRFGLRGHVLASELADEFLSDKATFRYSMPDTH
jgi:hypothetical protein